MNGGVFLTSSLVDFHYTDKGIVPMLNGEVLVLPNEVKSRAYRLYERGLYPSWQEYAGRWLVYQRDKANK